MDAKTDASNDSMRSDHASGQASGVILLLRPQLWQGHIRIEVKRSSAGI
jgi:hypothetical protein